jgi:hypothetical protein
MIAATLEFKDAINRGQGAQGVHLLLAAHAAGRHRPDSAILSIESACAEEVDTSRNVAASSAFANGMPDCCRSATLPSGDGRLRARIIRDLPDDAFAKAPAKF